MLFEKTSYDITTLCKPDDESIKKVAKGFNDFVNELLSDNPDLKQTIKIIAKNASPVFREVKGPEIKLVRLVWGIYGEKDAVENFLRIWKEKDQNPYRSFYVHPNYSIAQLESLMNI